MGVQVRVGWKVRNIPSVQDRPAVNRGQTNTQTNSIIRTSAESRTTWFLQHLSCHTPALLHNTVVKQSGGYHVCVCECIYMYVYMYVCMYVCMYVLTYFEMCTSSP